MNKFLSGPEPTKALIPFPRKHPSPAHAKVAKLERKYEAAEGKPLLQARILKSAMNFGRELKRAGVLKPPV